ncbi:branched-chain amino acid ABC transporter permease [Actinoalloteichus spitiensis]|uniref:branched-chain amino acid ABC transporter permease n=1 Tax=Actinoalloteichus spitiensis TaxID=252394 RepID=UPI00037C3D6C|nr:branched-chain amino acid ABC transporter permease [Actinoalloteichus spitiensis]
MSGVADILVNGVALGSVYALIAVGFVVVFTVSGVMNFAHGSLLLLGGYLTAVLHPHWGFLAAVVVAVAVTAAGAGLVDLVCARGRHIGQAHVLTIVTIGVDILLLAELSRLIGSDVLALGDPWGTGVVHLGGTVIAQSRIASVVVAVVLIATLFALLRWSRWGLSLRVVTSDREAAALMGVRLRRVRVSAWCVAGALAAVAAVFLAAFPTPGLDRATGQVALAAFPAAVLGGLTSVPGALVGSALIGLTEATVTGYRAHLGELGQSLGDVAPYLIMLLVLLVRPNGLLGAKETTRV